MDSNAWGSDDGTDSGCEHSPGGAPDGSPPSGCDRRGACSALRPGRGRRQRLAAAALGLHRPRGLCEARSWARRVPGVAARAADRRGSCAQTPARVDAQRAVDRAFAGRGGIWLATAGSAQRLRPAYQRIARADGGAGRRLQRSDRRSGSESLRRRIRSARMHRRKRLLQAGQPERRNGEPAVPQDHDRTGIGAQRHESETRRGRRSDRLGPRDLPRHRGRPRDV